MPTLTLDAKTETRGAKILEMTVRDSSAPLLDLSFEPAEERSTPAETAIDQPARQIDRVSATPAGERKAKVDEPDATQPGLMKRLFGSGAAKSDVLASAEKPGVFRRFARRDHYRETALDSIKTGFDNLSALMEDIRDGLNHSVERQDELLSQMRYLPVLAKQNAQAAVRMEEHFKQNTQQLARANELAAEGLSVQKSNVDVQRESLGVQRDQVRTQAEALSQQRTSLDLQRQNLEQQGEALRQQGQAVDVMREQNKSLREQTAGQRDQSDKLNALLNKVTREARDQNRDLEEFQGRLDRMRDSDQKISDNLGTVANAIRRVSEQAQSQGEFVAKLQADMEERTARMEKDAKRRGTVQGWVQVVSLMLAFAALGAVAGIGVIYLRHAGVL